MARTLPIPGLAEHGLVGDLHTVALVGTTGTIDWYCCPAFDSPSVFGAILVAYVLYTAVARLPREDRDRIFAAMFLILGSILFWALFEQAGSSLNLFTDRHVDRSGVPASRFQSVNAMFILIFMFALGPLIALIPLASLAAVLVIVAWNMSEIDHFRHFMRAPVGDIEAVGYLHRVLTLCGFPRERIS